jgi:hypothetical protein
MGTRIYAFISPPLPHSPPALSGIAGHLRRFASFSLFKRIALRVVAQSLPHEEARQSNSIFASLVASTSPLASLTQDRLVAIAMQHGMSLSNAEMTWLLMALSVLPPMTPSMLVEAAAAAAEVEAVGGHSRWGGGGSSDSSGTGGSSAPGSSGGGGSSSSSSNEAYRGREYLRIMNSDFQAAVMPRLSYANSSVLDAVFSAMDQDRDGLISIADLTHHLLSQVKKRFLLLKPAVAVTVDAAAPHGTSSSTNATDRAVRVAAATAKSAEDDASRNIEHTYYTWCHQLAIAAICDCSETGGEEYLDYAVFLKAVLRGEGRIL